MTIFIRCLIGIIAAKNDFVGVIARIGLDFTRLFAVNFSVGELNASHPFLLNTLPFYWSLLMKRALRFSALAIATSVTFTGMSAVAPTAVFAEEATNPPAVADTTDNQTPPDQGAVDQVDTVDATGQEETNQGTTDQGATNDQGNPTNDAQNIVKRQDASNANEVSEMRKWILTRLDEIIRVADDTIASAKAKGLDEDAQNAELVKQEALRYKNEASTTHDLDRLNSVAAGVAALDYGVIVVNRKVANGAVSEADVAKVRQEASQRFDAFLKEIDETLAIAEKKEQTDSVKNDVGLMRMLKTNVELEKQKLPTMGLQELIQLRNNIDLVAIEFRNHLGANIKGIPNKEGETTKDPEKSGQSSGTDSGARGIIGVILGVLGVGAIVAAIMQFGGPALKNLGVNLPGIPQQ